MSEDLLKALGKIPAMIKIFRCKTPREPETYLFEIPDTFVVFFFAVAFIVMVMTCGIHVFKNLI